MGSVAVFDLGTNTFRLLIASLDHNSHLKRHRVERRIVRMGENFVATEAVSEAAIKRGAAALKDLARQIDLHGVDRVTGVATGVFREAANGVVALDRLSLACNCPLRLLSGRGEGEYTEKGVTAGSPIPSDGDWLIIDIGGGSTEFIRRGPDGDKSVCSIPVGAVYLKERFGDSPGIVGAEALSAMDRFIDDALKEAAPWFRASRPMASVGTGGSITTLAYTTLGLSEYDPKRIHGSRLTLGQVERFLEAVLPLTADEVQARFHLEAGRADLVYFGGTLLRRILQRLPAREIGVSDFGLLEGVAMELLQSSGW